MTDYTDLKSIAEACQQHQPLRFMRSHGALYIRNDNGIVFDVHQNRSFPEFKAQNKDYADLVLAANPETILALIAENERLKVDLKSVVRLNNENANLFNAKNDQLKAENGRLESEAVYSAAGFDAAREEISKLRAEVAGLKTGYEACERVNAELKAEVEALRRDKSEPCDGCFMADAEALRKDAERYRWLRDSSESIHQFYLSTPIWFTGVKFSKENVDSTIDAALGQGEQS